MNLGLKIFHQLRNKERNKEDTSGGVNDVSHGSKSVIGKW